VPVVRADAALPIVAAAGDGDAACGEIMMPVSLALADHRGACSRIGGPSKGADDEAERSMAAGRPVFRGIGGSPRAARP
jgi:hypothetical protein